MSAASTAIRPQSLEEKVLWHGIVWTYGCYLLGALYVVVPVAGWLLLAQVARRGGLREVPAAVWVWVAGMLAMLAALIAGHADFQLGLGPVIKSGIGWAKGWALIAVFLMLGCGRVRLEVIARAVCWAGVQTLCLLPLFAGAWLAGLPERLYVSPLSIVGGPGPEFFAFDLYGISPDSGRPRWSFFAPWAPAIGLVMSAYVLIALNERDARLRGWGIAGMAAAIAMSGSRLGLIALPLVLLTGAVLRARAQPGLYLLASPMALVAGLVAAPLIEFFEAAAQRFHGARADSSRVRAALGRIAIDRWQQEAFWFGHGNVERGPHLVEFMPIGSHHTWFGLLFVKGIVGALALALPLLWTFVALLRAGPATAAARTALGLLLLLVLYTFAENLEILVYLFWPALVVIGLALRQGADDTGHATDPGGARDSFRAIAS